MKKQHVKNFKEKFQLPGKLALALENLIGQKQDVLAQFQIFLHAWNWTSSQQNYSNISGNVTY